MGQEIGTVLDSIVSDMALDFPGWNIQLLHPEILDFGAEEFTIVISSYEGTPIGDRGVYPLRMDVNFEAQVFWRYTKDENFQFKYPQDVCATVLSWVNKRNFKGTDGLASPVGFARVITQDAYNQPDKTSIWYTAMFTAPVIILPEISGLGQDISDELRIGLGLKPPLAQVYRDRRRIR